MNMTWQSMLLGLFESDVLRSTFSKVKQKTSETEGNWRKLEARLENWLCDKKDCNKINRNMSSKTHSSLFISSQLNLSMSAIKSSKYSFQQFRNFYHFLCKHDTNLVCPCASSIEHVVFLKNHFKNTAEVPIAKLANSLT